MTSRRRGPQMITHRTFLKMLAAAPLTLAARAGGDTVAWDEPQQTIDGFGASAAFFQARNLQQFPEPQRSQILDFLFSTEKGAGLSIVRNIVGDGGHWGNARNGPTPSIEPRPGHWNWKGDEDQIWFMREAAKRGCTRYMSTVWSPPAWMKTNASVIHGGRAKPEDYRRFAEYLSAYVRGYKQHHGIDIYAISPTNEPDQDTRYSSCLWSGEELRVLVRDHIAPVFARDKVEAKLLLGEWSMWSEEPYAPSLLDPQAAARVDIAASHAYTKTNRGYEPISLRTGDMTVARAAGKPIWQTEVSCFDPNGGGIEDALYWAQLLHTHVVENQVSAWLYWWAVFDHDSRSALVTLAPETLTYAAAKRLFALGNYSRFVRPGFQRVTSMSSPAPGVRLAAFRDPQSARRVAVAINGNPGPATVDFPAAAAAAAVYRTSADEELARLPDVAVASGRLAAALAAQSITTFVMG